jgi:23S rRNA (adenine2503-C2)-methyltransferase
LFHYKWQAALPYLVVIIATLSQLAGPRLVRNVIDAVTSGYIGDQVLKALDQIPAQFVSTALPKILELAETADRPHLAISLAAPTDELRNELMPINKRWPLEELLKACKVFEKSLKPGERFTFEYVMLAGVNDSEQQARQLANLLNRHGLKAKVNLIPHNAFPASGLRPPSDEGVRRFQRGLRACGVNSIVRRPRGRDIAAACGQLAGRSAAASLEV